MEFDETFGVALDIKKKKNDDVGQSLNFETNLPQILFFSL